MLLYSQLWHSHTQGPAAPLWLVWMVNLNHPPSYKNKQTLCSGLHQSPCRWASNPRSWWVSESYSRYQQTHHTVTCHYCLNSWWLIAWVYPWCLCRGRVERTGWITSALSRLENFPSASSRRGSSSLYFSSSDTSCSHITTGGADMAPGILTAVWRLSAGRCFILSQSSWS